MTSPLNIPAATTGAGAILPGGQPGPETLLAEQIMEALGSQDPAKIQAALKAFQQQPKPTQTAAMGQLDESALMALVQMLIQAGALNPGALQQQMGGGPAGGGGPRSAGAQPWHVPENFRRPQASMPSPYRPATTPGGPVGFEPNMKSAGKTPGQLLEKHKPHASTAQATFSQPGQKADAAAFKAHFEKNRARYEAVAQRTNMPADLVAALHWREGSGNFNTYMHQGDPLGKPATHVPRDIPVFHNWEDSAVHALGQKANYQKALGLTAQSTDPAAKAAYAELYNGLGYHYKGKPSPYVYAGTDKYVSGKYVRDGVYDPSTVDRQNGVLALMQTLR